MLGDKWIEVAVPEWWLCYLEYGDTSGYADDELDKIDQWFSDCKYISSGDPIGTGTFDGTTCDLCKIIVELRS